MRCFLCALLQTLLSAKVYCVDDSRMNMENWLNDAGRINQSTRIKYWPSVTLSTTNANGLTWEWIQASAIKSQRPTAWAMARHRVVRIEIMIRRRNRWNPSQVWTSANFLYDTKRNVMIITSPASGVPTSEYTFNTYKIPRTPSPCHERHGKFLAVTSWQSLQMTAN